MQGGSERALLEAAGRPKAPPVRRRAGARLSGFSRRVVATRTLALLALALGVLADLVADKPLGFLALPPLVAALALKTRATLAVALASLGAACGLAAFSHYHLTARAAHVLAVALAGLIAVWIVKVREERENLLARVVAIARIAQEAIVRPPAPRAANTAFAARYVAAHHEATIGGDLYEAAVTPYGVRIVIGDVRGKGLEAVQTAAAVLRAFRNRCQLEEDLAALVAEIDAEVRGALDSGEFVTAIFAELSPGGVLDVVNCGHPAPLCVGPTSCYLLEPSHRTTPIGIEPSALVDRFHLEPGERLLFYTDGLFDVGRESPQRLLSAGEQALRAPSLEDALDAVIAALVGDPATATDDVALLAIEHLQPARSFQLTAL